MGNTLINRSSEKGPFDIIGDVHGCFDELKTLLRKLGHPIPRGSRMGITPKRRTFRRKIIFLGDLVNRGPKTIEVLKLVMALVSNGSALCVIGNHDDKLLRRLRKPGTPELLKDESAKFRKRVAAFLEELPPYLLLDRGRLVVAHAGLPEAMQGKKNKKVRKFAVNGQPTGEIDRDGRPVRYNWAADYRGKAIVVYGHTPVRKPAWLHKTIDIDTGCVYGGALTALRYPERKLVSVRPRKLYFLRAKPLR